MREIKFRAWDIELKRYFHAFNYNGYEINDNNGAIYITKHLDKSGETPLLEIEQFTGLHDKSGKEIYEGDKFCIGGVMMFVSWHEDSACFILTTGCDYGTINYINLDCDVVYQKEIVGNIHESQ